VELAAHLRRSGAQTSGELAGAEVGCGSELTDGATAVHVSRARASAQGGEEVAELSLDRRVIAHLPESERAFAKVHELRRGKDDLFLEHVRTASPHALGERRAQRHDEELELGARFEQHVILPRLEEHELTGAELERAITDPDPRHPSNDGVHLGLRVKMAGATIRGLMSPELRGAPVQHGERLKECGVHAVLEWPMASEASNEPRLRGNS
jgi:hypothetical protein